MQESYTILEISKQFNLPINRIYEIISKENIKLENGRILSSSLEKLKDTLGIKEETTLESTIDDVIIPPRELCKTQLNFGNSFYNCHR